MTDEPAFAAMDYPGRRIAVPTLLTPDGSRRLVARGAALRLAPADTDPVAGAVVAGQALDDVLTGHGQPPLSRRRPVVAIGSNGSAAVVAGKLAAANVSAWVPMAPARIAGVAVGHSAHISLRGYIAAAPYAAPGAVTAVVVGWFSTEQLAALDASEPNYRRIALAPADYPLTVAGAALRVSGYDLYESVHGVISLGGRIVPFGTQAELHALAGADPRIGGVAPWADEGVLPASLSATDVREAFARMVREHGYARDSGLVLRIGR